MPRKCHANILQSAIIYLPHVLFKHPRVKHADKFFSPALFHTYRLHVMITLWTEDRSWHTFLRKGVSFFRLWNIKRWDLYIIYTQRLIYKNRRACTRFKNGSGERVLNNSILPMLQTPIYNAPDPSIVYSFLSYNSANCNQSVFDYVTFNMNLIRFDSLESFMIRPSERFDLKGIELVFKCCIGQFFSEEQVKLWFVPLWLVVLGSVCLCKFRWQFFFL